MISRTERRPDGNGIVGLSGGLLIRRTSMRAICGVVLSVALLASAPIGAGLAPSNLPAIDGVTTAAPEAVGMSPDRLARLDRVLQGYVDRGEIAGAVSLVARRGKVVHFSARGHRDREAGKQMTRDAIFRIASMTKPVASVALMMLYEEGRFQLKDPVSKWLPELADMKVASPAGYQELGRGPYRTVPASRPITVQHLLTHTSGLANTYRGITKPEFDEIAPQRKPGDTVGDMVKRLAKVPLNFEPGEAWEYGVATDVVGLLVEVMSGQRFDVFLRERIFAPLGMTDTHFYLPRAKLDRFAAVYRPAGAGRLELLEGPTPESRFVREPHSYFSGAGGLVSTARDYFRFNQMMLNGGELDGRRILGRKTIELMTANHTGDHDVWLVGPGHGFGLGYAVVLDQGKVAMPYSVGSYFWWGAFNTTFWIDPKEQLTGILLTQLRPYNHLNIRQDLATLTYQALVD
jgi:CubicO group peptidase (beta-lactamase class C family)